MGCKKYMEMDNDLLKLLLITSRNHGGKENIELIEIFVKKMKLLKEKKGKFQYQEKTVKVKRDFPPPTVFSWKVWQEGQRELIQLLKFAYLFSYKY